jgi:biotin carboxyl carrier protein
MQLQFQYNDETLTLLVEPDGDGWRVRLPDGAEHRITARRLPGDILQITESGPQAPGERVFRVPFAHTERGVEFSYRGDAYPFASPASQPASGRRRSASGALSAPMVGVVVDVMVEEGQAVEAYQPLVVIEAMKVMATVEAPFAGTVQAVHVRKQQRVEHGAPVVDIAPATEGDKETTA